MNLKIKHCEVCKKIIWLGQKYIKETERIKVDYSDYPRVYIYEKPIYFHWSCKKSVSK